MERRRFLAALSAGALLTAQPAHCRAQPAPPAAYKRADTDWLAKCRYGVSVHWTAQSVPRHGPRVEFQKAVDGFPLKSFVDSIVRTGAELFIFTTAHALQMMPAPHPVIDRIAPGRTCRRDLIAELTDALGEKGIPLILYYNHSCNSGQDAAWEKAAGYHDADKTRFAQNIIDIVGHMGDRYKEKAKAWWFDSPYSLDPRGPVNSVTTDMKGFQFPWEKLTTAAKLGFAGRLVTYNAGVDRSFLYTDRQDYYAGETNGLKSPATNRYLDSGLQNFRWTTLNGVEWVHTKPDTDQPPPRHSDEQVAAYIRACNAHQCPAAFNLGVDQEGIIDAASVEQMRRVDGLLKA